MSREIIEVRTSRRVEFIDITSEVEEVVSRMGVDEGAVNVFTMHTTTAIIVNENESGLLRDLEELMEKLVPRGGGYAHDRGFEGNADAHLRSILLGPSKLIPIQGGRLQLGTWQRIFFAEFDGPRNRKAVAQVLREK